jgi:phosphate-selective porin
MAKLFETSSDVKETIVNKFEETGLSRVVNLKIISTSKGKSIFKVTKASATTEFIANKDSLVQILVYEEAFDRLDDESKELLTEMVLSNVSYDGEKDKVVVETNPFKQVYGMRKKYGDTILDKMEAASLVIEEIEEEEKEKKQAEKEAKKAKKKH